MITDFEANQVWVSNVAPMDYKFQLKDILGKHNIKLSKLINTKDWYCRDYMPIQVRDDEFVQFVFRPHEYHADGEYGYITNPVAVQLSSPGIPQPKFSRIILDGGNVVRSHNKAIISNKVFQDNLYQFHKSKSAIQKELEEMLECQVIIIPRYPPSEDKTGHADGLVRFIGDNRVLINNLSEEPEKEWSRSFQKVLLANNLDISEVHCGLQSGDKTAKGLYINYLQVGNLIVVPKFNIDEDHIAFQDITQAFGNENGFVFEQIDATSICKNGGALNCATWTIKL